MDPVGLGVDFGGALEDSTNSASDEGSLEENWSNFWLNVITISVSLDTETVRWSSFSLSWRRASSTRFCS